MMNTNDDLFFSLLGYTVTKRVAQNNPEFISDPAPVKETGLKKHASRVFTSAKTEVAADAAVVADRFDTAVEPEAQPIAPEAAHKQLPVADPDDRTSSNVDPFLVEVETSTVVHVALEVAIDEPLGPFPLESYPSPPASPLTCILQNRDHNIFLNLVLRAPDQRDSQHFQ